MKKTSVLIIDDIPQNYDVIETFMKVEDSSLPFFESDVKEPPGYQLHYAGNGKDAIENLDLFNPDLILLDVMMPEMNGFEVCQFIKAMPRWQFVPIIMITALTTKLDLAQCLAVGADDFISKPIDSLELFARMRSMLRIKKQYDELQKLLKINEEMVQLLF